MNIKHRPAGQRHAPIEPASGESAARRIALPPIVRFVPFAWSENARLNLDRDCVRTERLRPPL